MKTSYKRWACGLLALACLALLGCGALVYTVDPCLYYRMPADGAAVFFNERYQNAGLARHSQADTVLLGTSMVSNYRPSQIEEVFGGTAVKLTVPDGYFSELDTVLEAVFRSHAPRRVLFGLDPNILVRDESGLTGALPAYLYDENPLNDLSYLLNKDTLYYSVYTLMEKRRGGGQSLDAAFTWDGDIWWNHITALENYQRPEIVEQPLPEEAYLQNASANLQVVEGWLSGHPDTEFDIFLPPYSLLFWDKVGRLGETEAYFSALELACRRLLAYDNVRLYGFLFDEKLAGDLDFYCDYIHHSGEAAAQVLWLIRGGGFRLEEENVAQTLANWREFVVNYDYDRLWDDGFWLRWNADHGRT